LLLAGSATVASSDALWVWGSRGGVGFAGIWVLAMNACGIVGVVMLLIWRSGERNEAWRPLRALLLYMLLLSAVTSVQATFYAVESLRQTTLSPFLGVAVLLFLLKVIEFFLKMSFHILHHLPAAVCAYVTFCFQVGGYLSLRLYLANEPDLIRTIGVSAAAGCIEVAMRVSSGLIGKCFYNHLVRQGRPERALRIMDVFVFEMVTNILSEISGVFMATSMSFFANRDLFIDTAGQSEHVWSFLIFQLIFELLSDLVSVSLVLAALPISLEGFFRLLSGPMLLSFIGAAMTYAAGLLNVRINIECFT